MRPKDVIAGVIKKQGNTKIKGGNRITLLRGVAPDGSAPELCVVDMSRGEAPRWYSDGKPSSRTGACPEAAP